MIMSRWTFVQVSFLFLNLLLFLIFVIIDNGDKFSTTHCSVRIPYSILPNLNFSSRAYQKAISTLAKQTHFDSHKLKTCSKSDDARLSAAMDIGRLFIPFCFDSV
jgi:hypothetical protein